jgi:hypothetical protein
MFNKLVIKDIYKCFKIFGSGSIYDIYVAKEHCDFNACRPLVMKKEVNNGGQVFSFLSHEAIFVPVNMNNVHWVLFVICPPNREILAINSLYDPTSPFHFTIYHNLVHFIQDYHQLKSLPQDRWAWIMRPITVKKQVNDDDCGVCLSLAIYCLVH